MGAFGGWPSSLRNCLPPFVGVNVVRPRRAWSADAALAGLRALHIDASSLRQDGSYRGKPGSGQAAPGGPTGLLCCGVVHEVARVTGGHAAAASRTQGEIAVAGAPRPGWASAPTRFTTGYPRTTCPSGGARQPDRHSGGDPDIEKTSQATDLGIAPAQQITGSAHVRAARTTKDRRAPTQGEDTPRPACVTIP